VPEVCGAIRTEASIIRDDRLLFFMGMSQGIQNVSLRGTICDNIVEKLTHLLKEFGPRRLTYHPEFPFCYLQTDGF
jgi:predicted restriction endonuclease